MSAIVDEAGESGPFEPIRVLISLHDGVDGMDVMGPLEVFSIAQHDRQDQCELLEHIRCLKLTLGSHQSFQDHLLWTKRVRPNCKWSWPALPYDPRRGHDSPLRG